ncbi:probable iron/ascorbate oxidoreductase DDB_G0283291 [Lingula anatina]|uniref:Probable iron/ascorbate oxidoreductase DDB_G0283291 n=1 Tax=Lingula anatina TaxID=7574 RepID=A0A1S3H2G7_LINAN|nr:probable iron/ascorbate oxidoreductase DDB_G0283291 [Lingula anatina]|eukprot:XP_013380208.1 probable iron/ascorbate oxidoreductase DDB_G0283291 [Lingula anatina]
MTTPKGVGLDSLPVIDLSKIHSDREGLAAKLVHAMEHVGFVYLDNVPGFNSTELLRMASWFLTQPEQWKKQVATKVWNPNPEVKNLYRGYFPVDPKASSYKEGFEIGIDLPGDDPDSKMTVLYEPNLWPVEDATSPSFRQYMTDYYKNMTEIGIDIMQLIAIGLEIEENSFTRIFSEKPLSTLRLIRYPRRYDTPPEVAHGCDGHPLHCNEHSDSVFLTLLATFNYAGLQIQNEQGHWVNVTPRPNGLVMNIGDVLQQMTGGRLKATRHRVLDLGVERMSVAFFLEPNYHADISRALIEPKLKDGSHLTDATNTTYGPWLINRMKNTKKNAEYKDADFY